jgi:hypothetical protein
MKPLNLALITLCMLFSFAVMAQESLLKPQTQGDVTFVSGGVGGDEWDAMQAVRAEYNLRMLFTVQGTGEYLSNVTVKITDAKGNVYLETVAEGPLCFVKLNPGRYTITADLDGKSFQKKVTVGKKPVSLSFVWPQ